MSEITYAEIDKCAEPKRAFMRSMLAGISSDYAEQSEESEHLRNLYIDVGGLPPKSLNDSMHIAIATVNNCDIILSWNFKHMVNLRAMKAVAIVNVKEGYNVPQILSPSMMIDEEEE